MEWCHRSVQLQLRTGGGDSCPAPTVSPQQRANCFCSGKALGRYQDVTYGCAGRFWCYGSGAQYIQCASGLRYDPITGVCHWAASVPTTCSASIVGRAAARLTRRAGPVDATLVSVPAEQDGQVAATAAAVEPAAVVAAVDPTAPVVPAEAAAVAPVVEAPVEASAAAPVDAATAAAAVPVVAAAPVAPASTGEAVITEAAAVPGAAP